MKPVERIFVSCSKILPRRYKKKVQTLLNYAGMEESPDIWLGGGILFGVLAMTIAVQLPKAIYGVYRLDFIVGGMLLLAFMQLMAYLVIFFKAEERTKKVEDALPDAFQMIAANLRSGMTPYKALKLTTSKEFGPLQEEINRATSRAMGVTSFADTLLQISERINSELLDRSLKLFTTAMKSGGRLANVLEELAADISETHALKRELSTNTKTYTAFIMFTIICGTPLLLAISVNFVDMIASMQERNPVNDVGFGMGFLIGEVTITVDFLTKLSFVVLGLTAVLASMLLGVINEGKSTSGLRYAPTVLAGSYAMFFLANHAVSKYIIGFG